MEKLPLDVTVTVQIHGDIFPSEGWPLAEIPGCCLTLQDEARQTKKQQRSKRKKSKHGKRRAQGQRWNQLTVVATESVLINRQRLSSWVKNQTRLSQAQDGPEMLKVMEAHGTALLDASGTNKVLTPSQSRGGGQWADITLIQTPKPPGQDVGISDGARGRPRSWCSEVGVARFSSRRPRLGAP